MRKLLEFIVAQRHWILFLFFEIISFVLIYRNNAYQRNMILSSANVVAGGVSSVSNSIFSYLYLKGENRRLIKHVGELEMEVIRLRELLDANMKDTVSIRKVFVNDTISTDSIPLQNYPYRYIPAGVVRNTTNYLSNYITINKGFEDGIRSDMGVVSPDGVVGIVMTVGSHYSVVISLLNVKLKISCKIKNTNYFGALSWKGGDVKYAYLEELPSHSTFEVGDTIVTSGYSAVFPRGVMVGIVESYNKQNDDNFYSLKVRLLSDFQSLGDLFVIENPLQKEQKDIEKEAVRND
ncbi:MAG: rod shape-determining protein MreC [Tannerella sp.]|jgi:rod shape-determining protein MreC|nr:rod shape-determining protein MreC [Tannerella sp.]